MISKQSNAARLASNIKSAIGANLLPGLWLQLFALTIGLSYFYWPASQQTFQFVFSVFVTSPFIALAFLWKDQQFNWQQTKIHFDDLIKVQIPTTIVTTWIIWIPAVSLIYMMPSNLQIPLFNLVLCFFVLILAILNVDEK